MIYTIKQVADQFHLTTQAIRYYEKAGLLPKLRRDSNGVRVFHEDDVEWISMLRCLRETGMNIRQLQEYVELFNKGDRTIKRRKEILMMHKLKIEQDIKSLQHNLETVECKVLLCEKGIV